MVTATLQVFEHATIRVGEPVPTVGGGARALGAVEHAALAGFADRTRDRYFVCGRRTVRFGSYVGLVQVGELAIEVLPKVDRHGYEHGGELRWHAALVRMLRQVGDLGLESADEAELRTHPGRLFELFVRHFLDACERLLREGLAKSYRSSEENVGTFRGRLLVAPHVRANASNAARFYVEHTVYDHGSLPNQVLYAALSSVETLPLSSFTRARARTLRGAFPEVPRWVPDASALALWRPSRNTSRYATAVRLASLLLFGLAADVRRGSTPLLALLFDMNSLWERYVAAVARRANLEGFEARTQDARTFWRDPSGPRSLRPDLTLRTTTTRDTRLVVDTKWKVPRDARPSSADLKQMFCYHELFACSRSLLLYPSATTESYVSSMGRFAGSEQVCALGFLSVDGDTRADLAKLLRVAMEAS